MVLILPVEETDKDRDVEMKGEDEHELGEDAVEDSQSACAVPVPVVEPDSPGKVHGQAGEGIHGAIGTVQGVTRSSVKEQFRSCQMLKSTVVYEDSEKTIYFNWSEAFDWEGNDHTFNVKN